MPNGRESPIHHHDPCKVWKSLVLPSAGDAVQMFMKAALIACAVASISLVSYFALSGQPPRPICAGELKNSIRRSESSAAAVPPESPRGNSAGNAPRTNISHIVFGIGGSTNTWHNRRHYCEVWWRRNVTRGFVWLDAPPPANETWPDTSPPYRVSANTSEFRYTSWYGSRSAVRIARILKETFEAGLGNVRWFVMGDDDTVFFLENLVRVLRKYDHNEMYYVGGNSESVEQDVVHSYGMAYGGGGFAVSYPLAAELVRALDGCINRYHSFYGSDQKIQACLDEIGVPLTKEVGFHQLDIRGDPYGLLATHPVAPLVSLHHLDYLRPIFPTMNRVDSLRKLVQSHGSDPGRTLQHSFCYDLRRNWTVYVSWGYTAQLYPGMVTAKVLETPLRTFLTWKGNLKPFTFNTRVMGPDPCNRPVVFFLDRTVRKDTSGRTLTTYAKLGRWGERDCPNGSYATASEVNSVNVSADELAPDYWEKAPRRQCCEVIDGGDDGDKVVHVEIRSCRAKESATPP